VKVELIPVIELPTRNWEKAGTRPEHPYSRHAVEWETHWDNLQRVSGYHQHYNRINPGVCFYRVNQFANTDDLALIIDRHLHPGTDNEAVPIRKSTPLFGGYVLKLNDEFKLYPQCCCDLGDIVDWIGITKDDYESGYLFTSGGHPQPKVTKRNNEITLLCEEDETGSFSPFTDKEMIFDLPPFRKALEEAEKELLLFASEINKLSFKYQVNKLSDYLIGQYNYS
jgi:hypothetical protein